MSWIEDRGGSCYIHLRVIPKAGRRELAGIYNDRLKVKVNSPPEAGKANREISEYFAKLLHVPKTFVELVQGETSQNKTIRIAEASSQDVACRLGVEQS